jgi:ATP-dependent Clp protease ATP-binding subunit ClpX
MSRCRNAYCSFCRKSYRDVGPLVEGPDGVYICGECIELCTSIIHQEIRRRARSSGPDSAAVEPRAVRAKLDQLIAGQEEAKEALVPAASSRGQSQRPALLVGRSPGSRVLLAKALAHVLEVPFAAGVLQSLAPSPGHGGVACPLLYSLMQAADFDAEAAQRGVVYVEGADGQEAQEALLRLWRRPAVEVATNLQMDVQGVWFICGGRFDGLDDVITRLGRHPEQPLSHDVLTAFGAMQEWVLQLGVIARAAPIDEETLARMVAAVDLRRLGSGTAGHPDS